MDRSCKRWELALFFGLLMAMSFGGWLQQEQQDLADRVIRFHVLAHSDRREDQELKLAVRDRVLAAAEDLYPQGASLEEARQALEGELDTLAQAGQQVADQWGTDYRVTAELERCWFPTKEYDGFTLPAGHYEALRILIGEGKGQNWWCVAFPPLCLSAAEVTLEDAVEAGLFTSDQAALVRGQGEGYILKFKAMELLGNLRLFRNRTA